MLGVALVLGAGRGARLGGTLPKALVRVAGRTLLAWSADAMARARGIDGVLCVLPPDPHGAFEELRADWTGPARLLEPVVGGETRQESVARGTASIARSAPGAEWVLVHDAARCFVEPQDAERVLAAAVATGAAVPVVPLADTVKEVRGDCVVRTPERRTLALVQTPQAFRVGVLREALEKAAREGFEGTDCASLVERLGVVVRTCAGRPENWKLTHAADLPRAEALLRRGGAR